MYVAAGSILEAMAAAVEDAVVVLVCMTEKYKESPNCRTGKWDDVMYGTFSLTPMAHY